MLLALDTSTLTLSLALLERAGPGASVIEERTYGPPAKQSELLPGVVADLLVRHRVALASLEGMVIGLGPGSFTGLRIGLATVKALAYSARLRVAGVSSLAAAAMAGAPGMWLAVAVARKGELYVGRYLRTAHGVQPEGAESAMAPPALAQLLRETPHARALGPALPEYGAQLLELGVRVEQLSEAGVVPSASALAQLAALAPTYHAQALFALEPHYVRASEAERNPKFPPLPGPPPAARIL